MLFKWLVGWLVGWNLEGLLLEGMYLVQVWPIIFWLWDLFVAIQLAQVVCLR